MMTNRVAFLVDGFNLYYSLRYAAEQTGASTKWLDLQSLCSSYLTSVFGKTARLDRVSYFSAYATFLAHKPDTVRDHSAYTHALEATGVKTHMGRFKWKPKWCPKCKKEYPGYEEKETDVAIAVTMMELCHQDACDTIALVTGDTDLLPPIRSIHKLFPNKKVWAVFPWKRFNEHLRLEADGTIKIKRDTYARHQLPDQVVDTLGVPITKPADW